MDYPENEDPVSDNEGGRKVEDTKSAAHKPLSSLT
jgi:hypothetical protein